MDSEEESSSAGEDSDISDGGVEDHMVANGPLQPMQWAGGMESDDDSESSSGVSSNASSDGNADARGAAGPHLALEADAEGPRGPDFGNESADDQPSSSDEDSEHNDEAQELSDASSSSDSESEDTDDQPDFDVQHIGALLAATPPQAGPLGTGRGRQRNRGPPQAPGAENGPSPSAPHKDQSRVPEDRRPAKRLCRHPECTAGASGPACGSCAGPSSSSEAGAIGGSGDPGPSGTARSHDYNRPKATANPKVVECTACECKVGIGPDGAGWSTHISGITHRRILLALGNGLSRNEIVVSMFEDTSSIGPKGKFGGPSLAARCETGFIKGRPLQGGDQPPLTFAVPRPQTHALLGSSAEREISDLHSAVQLELLMHVGASDKAYNGAVSRLSLAALKSAWHYLSSVLPDLDSATGLLRVGQASPAVVACLSARLPQSNCRVLNLSLASCHPGDSAATAAGLCLLARALMRCSSIVELDLRGPVWPPATSLSRPQDLHPLQRLWKTVLTALEPAVQHRLGALSLKVSLEAEMRADDVAALRLVAEGAATCRRLTSLSAFHRRFKDPHNPLPQLPRDLLTNIIELSIPSGQPACRLSVTAQNAAAPNP